MGDQRTRRFTATLLSSVGVGVAVMFLARAITRVDPALTLAYALGLGSGVVLGAVLGGLFGTWLVLGGSRRVAGTAGSLIAIAVIVAAWLLAQPYFWIVDITMNQVFGEGGDQYSGLVLFLIAIPLFRTSARTAAALAGRMLERRPRSPASPPGFW